MKLNYLLQIAGMIFIPFIIVLIPVYIGRRIGVNQSKDVAESLHAPVGTVVAAAFGLLAFMLAFTFQIATNRYDARKQLLLDEVTQIRTAFLRAKLLPEPFNSESRKLLVEYTDLRVMAAADNTKLPYAISHSHQILGKLWEFAVKLAGEDRSSEVYALFTSTINDLTDNFNQRITMTFEYRMPSQVLWILFIIAFFSMLILGYQFGISGKGSLSVNIMLAMIFAAVMFLILSLNSPEIGLIKLNQQPVITLQNQLHEMQLVK